MGKVLHLGLALTTCFGCGSAHDVADATDATGSDLAVADSPSDALVDIPSADSDAGGDAATDTGVTDGGGGPCVSGVMSRIGAVEQITAIGINANLVAATQADGTGLTLVPKAGGSPTVLQPFRAGSYPFQPGGVALDDRNVYWANQPLGQIAAIPISGGRPTVIATVANSGGARIVVDRGMLFYPDHAQLWAVPVSAGSPVQIAGPSGLGPGIHDLVMDGDSVVYCDERTVQRVSRTGGATTMLYSAGTHLVSVAVDADAFYVADAGADTSGATGTVIRVARAGGAMTTLATGQRIGNLFYQFGQLAIDDRYVYWSHSQSGTRLMRVSKAGGTPPEVLAMVSGQAFSIINDTTALYVGIDAGPGGENGVFRYCK